MSLHRTIVVITVTTDIKTVHLQIGNNEVRADYSDKTKSDWQSMQAAPKLVDEKALVPEEFIDFLIRE